MTTKPKAKIQINLSSTGTRPIFNPLAPTGVDHPPSTVLSSDSPGLVSTSSMVNVDVGMCPKCKAQMARGTIVGGDTVFYCPEHRIAMPRPNDLYGI